MSLFIYNNILIGISVWVVVYSLLRVLLRNKILTFWDPLHFGTILTAFSISGLLVSIYILDTIPVNGMRIFIIFFAYFIGVMTANKPNVVNVIKLSISPLHQLIIAYSTVSILILHVILNEIFGFIGLVEGTQSRASMGDVMISPTLAIYSFTLGDMLVLLYLLSEYKHVKIVSIFGIIISFISSLLLGGKSGIFGVIIWIACGVFINQIKLIGANNAVEINNDYIKTLKKNDLKLKKLFLILFVISILLLPIWLIYIKAGEGFKDSAMAFISRLFLGYDNFIWLFNKNIDIVKVDSNLKLIDLWFYPFVKHITGTPEFQSAGEYAVFLATSDREYAAHGLNPNSNLILELIFTHGIWISIVIAYIIGYFTFAIRSRILSLKKLDIVNFSYFYLFVIGPGFIMGPLSFLQDGSYYIGSLTKTLIYILFIWMTGKILKHQKHIEY